MNALDVSLAVAVAIAAALWLTRRASGAGALAAAMLLAAGVTAAGSALRRSEPPPRPIAARAPEYVSSGACRSCHPGPHQSWHRSFHRTMTQLATPGAVHFGARARVDVAGRTIELSRRGDALWARLPDPSLTSPDPHRADELLRAAPEVERRIELVTGSHHQQAFWVRGKRDGELRAVPVVWLIEEGRLVPRRDAFLRPPHDGEPAVAWNSNCIQCHSVAGAPAHDEATDRFDSEAAELGIACEACHGPGARHVERMRNPLRRYTSQGAAPESLDIVNPARLSAPLAADVCGQCHSYSYPVSESRWWRDGSRDFRPGRTLASSRTLLTAELLGSDAAPALSAAVESLFYRDGTIRVAGREYNGMVASACFSRGSSKNQVSCVSCHSMHSSDPEDQLSEAAEGNGACASCHSKIASRPSLHTRHADGSPGSLCYNCHMPKTTYALLGAVRQHRIASPAFDDRAGDRPNACNLCHLERSNEWARARVNEWFRGGGASEPETAPVPSGAEFALSGDAAARAITAAALGRKDAPEMDVPLRASLLAGLLEDEYAAVRFVAAKSLRALPGFESFEFDYLAAPEARAERARAVSSTAGEPRALGAEQRRALRLARDLAPITISE